MPGGIEASPDAEHGMVPDVEWWADGATDSDDDKKITIEEHNHSLIVDLCGAIALSGHRQMIRSVLSNLTLAHEPFDPFA